LTRRTHKNRKAHNDNGESGDSRTYNNKQGGEKAIIVADGEGKPNLIESGSVRVLSDEKTGKDESWAV
jgi:hypothetical protein